MEFNREQIIQALEHCISSTTSEACNGCPLSSTDICIQMENGLMIYALDLIKELSKRTKHYGLNTKDSKRPQSRFTRN